MVPRPYVTYIQRGERIRLVFIRKWTELTVIIRELEASKEKMIVSKSPQKTLITELIK